MLTLLLGEPLFAAILASLPAPWNGLVHYVPHSAVQVLGEWMGTLIGGATPEHVIRAVVVLVGYTVALSGLALVFFRRRELTA